MLRVTQLLVLAGTIGLIGVNNAANQPGTPAPKPPAQPNPTPRPTNPTPSQPSLPEQPQPPVPSQPSQPAQPQDPIPTQPAAPGQPQQPVPAQPGTPGQPQQPVPKQPGTVRPTGPLDRNRLENRRLFKLDADNLEGRLNETAGRLGRLEKQITQNNQELLRRLGEVRQMSGDRRAEGLAEVLQGVLQEQARLQEQLVQMRTAIVGDIPDETVTPGAARPGEAPQTPTNPPAAPGHRAPTTPPVNPTPPPSNPPR